MKRILFLVCFFAILSACGFSHEVNSILSSYDKDLVLLEVIAGNFTGSTYSEYIAFFDIRKKYSEQTNKSVHKVICFMLDGDKIIKSIELPGYQTALFDNTTQYYNIKGMNFDELGKKFTFGWVGDFNSNKLDEVYLYQVTSWGFYPSAYEFSNGEFKRVLRYEAAYAEITSVDVANKAITLLEYGDKKKFIVFKWNAEKKEYVQGSK